MKSFANFLATLSTNPMVKGKSKKKQTSKIDHLDPPITEFESNDHDYLSNRPNNNEIVENSKKINPLESSNKGKGQAEKNSDMMQQKEDFSKSSVIRKTKKVDSNQELTDMLKDIGLDFDNSKEQSPSLKSGMKKKIHIDMEHTLGKLYEENGLTIVSEEQSKQFTEYNFGGKSKADISLIKGDFFENGSPKMNGRKLSFNQSVDPQYANEEQKQKSDPRKKTSNFLTPYKNSKNKLLSKSTNLQSSSEEKVIKFDLIILKKNPRSQKTKNKLQISMPKNDKNLLPAIKSISLFENAEKNKQNQKKDVFFENYKHLKKGLHQNPKVSVFEFDKEQLPEVPKAPEFQIDLLSNVYSNKEIRKKEIKVVDAFFRLSCGLFYEGELSFGKMDGRGMLLLKSIDTSDRSSTQVEKYLLYEGEFQNNQVHGKGLLRFRDGVVYKGTFNKGLAHGNGQIIDQKGEICRNGIWLEGKYYH